MKKMIKTYFSHPSIHFYLFLFVSMIFISIKLQLWESHALYFILPIAIAPFFEWFAHKVLLHRIISPENKRAFEYQKRLHYNHHIDPTEVYWDFAPLSSALAIFVFIFLLFSLIGLSFKAGLAAMTFAIGFFLYYEWVHLGHHLSGYDHITPYGKTLKKAHMWHHYANENYWWGVTSNIADIILRTYPDPKQVPHSPHVRDISKSEGPKGMRPDKKMGLPKES